MQIFQEMVEQNVIVIQEGEFSFFEEFTKKNHINWGFEEKKNNILSLSRSYVGYINTPNRIISLVPKYHEIGFEHIIRMYLYVYGYRPTDSSTILDISNAEESIDIADMFIKNLRKNVQEGIIRTYTKRLTKLGTIKGKVNYTKTYMEARCMKKKCVFTKVSSLSLENEINNLILSALCKLQHITRYASVSAELSMYFNGAKSNITNGSAVLEKISFNSNTARYRRTLIYAAMIIDQLSYSDTGATVGTDSFLINFDRLFENFVVKILKEIPEKKEFSTWTSKRKFAEIIGMSGKYDKRDYQPDILYRFKVEDEKYDYSPSAYAVLDVKNKAYGLFKNADMYQMLTYIHLLHGKKAVVLYPSFQLKKPEQLVLDPNIFSPSVIHACFINIAEASGEDFLKSIHWFVDLVVKTIEDIPV